MSAPSQAHEDRVDTLRSVASLAGFHCDVTVGDALVPDLARMSTASRALFVGDAKATESSGCSATNARLQRYLRAADANIGRYRAILLVIAHGDIDDRCGWEQALGRALASSVQLPIHAHGSQLIDDGCVLTWAVFGIP